MFYTGVSYVSYLVTYVYYTIHSLLYYFMACFVRISWVRLLKQDSRPWTGRKGDIATASYHCRWHQKYPTCFTSMHQKYRNSTKVGIAILAFAKNEPSRRLRRIPHGRHLHSFPSAQSSNWLSAILSPQRGHCLALASKPTSAHHSRHVSKSFVISVWTVFRIGAKLPSCTPFKTGRFCGRIVRGALGLPAIISFLETVTHYLQFNYNNSATMWIWRYIGAKQILNRNSLALIIVFALWNGCLHVLPKGYCTKSTTS